MKYKNARDVLPKELLREIKKYAAGTLLYIPSDERERQEAQSSIPISEFKQGLLIRNQRIFNEFQLGRTIAELADEYFLSLDTVKKIVYGKTKRWIPFHFEIETAVKYASSGLTEEWIRTYLMRKGGNEYQFREEWICDGLVRFPLRLLDAVVNTKYQTTGSEPFLIHFADHKFIYYGNENWIKLLKEQKQNSFPAFIIIEDRRDYSFYYENYGKPFSRGHMQKEG